jgi:pteridine reductase
VLLRWVAEKWNLANAYEDVLMSESRVALITGAAHRLGAEIAHHLHQAGLRVLIHYRNSNAPADALAAELNALRPDSARTLAADLLDLAAVEQLAQAAQTTWGRVDVLINNASTYYPTPIGSITSTHWDDLIGSNLRAPLFLSQALAPSLKERGGSIVNMVDIHAEKPLPEHPVYSVAKAGLAMLTRALATELSPEVRVNAVAPGIILWPERELSNTEKSAMLERVALGRKGEPSDIAETVRFLALDAIYVTGQIIAVDGGRSLTH